MNPHSIPGRIAGGVAAAIIGILALAVPAAAAGMVELGATHVQGEGFFGLEVVTDLPLIETGQTYARVTDGDCDAPQETDLLFDARLAPTDDGAGTWAGDLAPVSPAAAARAAGEATEGKVQLLAAEGGATRVAAYLEGMPEGRTFRVCLGLA